MTENLTGRPEIIVVALDIDPRRGSEPGKGWWWSSALSQHFRLHIVTQAASQEACRQERSVQDAGWTFHPTKNQITTWRFPTGYRQYAAWLKEALHISADLIKHHPIAGLCHVTLGSFRVIADYQSLGIPYVIGPMGGGECAPMRHLWTRPIPFAHKLSETIRPLFNMAFSVVPHLRRTFESASLTMATSLESEQAVQRIGARKTAVVFPDSYDQPVAADAEMAKREGQLGEVGSEVRLLWQGRPLWWKGPDLGLLLVHRALAAGVRLRLTMVSSWDGPFGVRIRSLIERLEIQSNVDLLPPVSRNEFLRIVSGHHGFVATSLHDSGGIPLIEAQAFGLPCLTLGLGGHREAACPEAGVSSGKGDTTRFLNECVECLQRWQRDPAVWLREAGAAIRFAGQFSNARLQRYVRELIVPAFSKSTS